MKKATHLLIAAAAVTVGFAVPDAHAEGKPGDVQDPTLGQVAPADAAQRILRLSHVQPQRARGARRAHRRHHATAASFSGHEQ